MRQYVELELATSKHVRAAAEVRDSRLGKLLVLLDLYQM